MFLFLNPCMILSYEILVSNFVSEKNGRKHVQICIPANMYKKKIKPWRLFKYFKYFASNPFLKFITVDFNYFTLSKHTK